MGTSMNENTEPSVVSSSLEYAGTALEVVGVLVIVIGAIAATWVVFRALLGGATPAGVVSNYRANLGRGILLGLEFLVAADIVRTVAVAPTWSNVGVLAVIIVIRTFLSMVLEVEINGKLPWQGNK